MNKFIDFIIAFSLKRKYLILVVTLAVIVLGVVETSARHPSMPSLT